MDDVTSGAGWWGSRATPRQPLSITRLIRDGTLDARLAALLWVLLEARTPLLVAAEQSGGATTALTALLDLLPPGTSLRVLKGATEDFAWLPQAPELGWSLPRGSAAARPAPADPSSTYLLASELGPGSPASTWGLAARVAIRSIQLGYGFAATIRAASLEEVLRRLEAPPVELSTDELRRLGVVLVVRSFDEAGRLVPPDPGEAHAAAPGARAGSLRRRVAAAHYVRPLERDREGHLQRRPPAVLATWDPASGEFEHFAWGVMPELAERIGRPRAEVERLHAGREAFLAQLVGDGVLDISEVRAAVRDQILGEPSGV